MNAPTNTPSAPAHPLGSVAGVSAESARRLKERWIETAEQALAATATPEGREGLRELLGMDAAAFEGFLGKLIAAVGAERAAELQKPVDPRARGVVLTEEQKRRMGIAPERPGSRP